MKYILEYKEFDNLSSEEQEIKDKAISDGTFMKAPNGKKTRLNTKQWIQVRTKNFINWFGDWLNNPDEASKIVDENGEPLIVYHGTNADFSEFNVGNENGIFFTESPRIASGYAENIRKGKLVIHKNQDGYIGSNVIPVYLSLQNPNIINFYNQLVVRVKTKINKSIQEGYDSVIIINGNDFMDSIGTFNQYVAFSPTQIKSVNNNGDFNPNNKNITK